MARPGSRSSEPLSTPAAGLASILRDHKARYNVLVGSLTPQPASIASSPESSVSEAETDEDDPDELKEVDVWSAETRILEPHLSKPGKHGEANGFHCVEPRVGPGGFSIQKLGGSEKSLGLGGPKSKMSNAGGVVRSSPRRQERRCVVSDVPTSGVHSLDSRPLESSPSGLLKSPSHRSTASWMIPQLGGVSKHSPKRHAERQSAPVQVPDWSTVIVKHKGKPVAAEVDGDEEGNEDDDDDDRLPPHELLAREYARSQRTPFSVCEGHGRTLKGRDLSRVRDAVWSQMGFAD